MSEAPAPPHRRTRSRLARLVPAIGALRGYGPADARADLVAGLTVAAVAVPQAMAYAMAAGLPPEHGLYTAIVMTAAGALFDASRLLVNGPTNAISIAVLSALAFIPPGERVGAAVVLAFWVGVIQIGITLLRLGDLTRYVSSSVIIGFTAGAAALLVLVQLGDLLGLPPPAGPQDHIIARLARACAGGGGIRPEAIAVGLASLGAVIGLQRLKERLGWAALPEMLIVVAAAAALTRALHLDARGVTVLGPVPAKLPRFAPPDLDLVAWRRLSTAAFSIALLGLLEAISMSKVIAAKSGRKVDMNQQCLSEGLANLTGSFFQCFPGSGSLTRSAINQQSGARSQWSAILSAAAVAAIVVLFGSRARDIPRATLAAILAVSAFRMVDVKALRYHARATYFDAAIVVVTAVSAVVVSVEFCVLVGVFLSFVLTVPRAGRMHLSEFVVSPEGAVTERLPEDAPSPRLLIFGLEGELFFGASAALEDHFQEMEDRVGPETRVVLLRLKRAKNPDAVAVGLLEGFLDRMRARGVRVLLCGVREHLHEVLVRTGAVDRIGERIFLEEKVRQTSTLKALEHACTLLDDSARGASAGFGAKPHRNR